MDNLYANVPRDLTRVKSKLFLNLTRRQILCFGAAIGVGLPLYFLLRKTGNSTMAAMAMILVMLPFFFFAMYERNGQPLEVVLRHFITARFKRPRIRRYRTKNLYRRKAGRRRDRRRAEEVVRQETTGNAKKETAGKKKVRKKTAKRRKEAGHVRKA